MSVLRVMESADHDGNVLAIVVLSARYEGAFTITGGELVEATEKTSDGQWDWSSASICDGRGDNPELQRGLRYSLEALVYEDLRAHGFRGPLEVPR